MNTAIGKFEYKVDVIGKDKNGLTVSRTITGIHADSEASAKSEARARVERSKGNFAKRLLRPRE